jgi:hypothetical protein
VADNSEAQSAAVRRSQEAAVRRSAREAKEAARRYNRQVQEHNEAIRRARKAASRPTGEARAAETSQSPSSRSVPNLAGGSAGMDP